MSDDALHPDPELASAYLDGDLDADARATVESSPELMAMVDGMRRAHSALADVPPPPAAARDAAFAAALSVFDELAPATDEVPAAAAAFTAPNVVPLRRRRATTILSAAAALLLVGVVGVAVLANSGKDDQSSSGAPDDAATQMASATSPEVAADSAAGGADSPSTISGITGPAAAAPQVDDTDELLQVADEFASTTAGVTADSGAPADTSEKAATTAPAPSARTSSGAFGCPLSADQVFVTNIIWVDTTAAVIRNVATGEVSAIDQQCNVLASVTP